MNHGEDASNRQRRAGEITTIYVAEITEMDPKASPTGGCEPESGETRRGACSDDLWVSKAPG
jgi:hypothetical protein